jgi:copper chaperone
MTTMRTYQVDGMTCDHCKAAIEEEVGALDGVEAVLADVATGTVVVTGDVAGAEVRAAVEEVGYEVLDI